MKFNVSLLLPLLLISLSGEAWAHERWRDMSPDDRQQMRRQMREHWQQDDPRRGQRFDGYNEPRGRDMPPEDRRRLRDEMRERGNPPPWPSGRNSNR